MGWHNRPVPSPKVYPREMTPGSDVVASQSAKPHRKHPGLRRGVPLYHPLGTLSPHARIGALTLECDFSEEAISPLWLRMKKPMANGGQDGVPYAPAVSVSASTATPAEL